MIWLKIQLPGTSFWIELQSQTHLAMEQAKGMELGLQLFAQLPAQIADTRLSKHPIEPIYDLETAKQIIKEETQSFQQGEIT